VLLQRRDNDRAAVERVGVYQNRLRANA
jgi:hypothetical protein